MNTGSKSLVLILVVDVYRAILGALVREGASVCLTTILIDYEGDSGDFAK